MKLSSPHMEPEIVLICSTIPRTIDSGRRWYFSQLLRNFIIDSTSLAHKFALKHNTAQVHPFAMAFPTLPDRLL